MMTGTRRTVLLSATLIGLVALAGCSAPVPTPSTSPTPTSTPSTDPIDLDDPSSWVIDFESVGPVEFGEDAADARESLSHFEETTLEECRVAMFEAPATPALWIVPPSDGDPSSLRGIVLTAEGDPGAAAPGSPTTEEGIGVGSTVDDLKAAYPDLVENEPVATRSSYSLAGPGDTFLVFTLDQEQPEFIADISVLNSATPAYEVCA